MSTLYATPRSECLYTAGNATVVPAHLSESGRGHSRLGRSAVEGGPDWQRILARQANMASKVQWIAQQTVQLTGLDRLGEYPTLLFGVDRLFSNED